MYSLKDIYIYIYDRLNMIVLELSYLTYRRKKVNDNSKITVANGVKKSE